MPDVITLRRTELLADRSLDGPAFCTAWSAAVDTWLAEVFGALHADTSGLCLLAVGGYGRGALAPNSDLDVVLVHRGRKGPDEALLRELWYPIWDTGLRLGHAVRRSNWRATPSDDELDTATSLLSTRVLAGDVEVGRELADHALAAWRKDRHKWLPVLRARGDQRHQSSGEVAFMLEPDLKQGRGGLRDVHTVDWLRAAGLDFIDADLDAVADAERSLLDVRVALHRTTQRTEDVIRLEDQDAVAESAGFGSATAMMTRLATVARELAWVLDSRWAAHDRSTVSSWPAPERVASGVVRDLGEIHLAESASVRDDPTLLLRVAIAAARSSSPIARATLVRLGDEVDAWTEDWPAGAVDEFVAFMLEGDRAIPVWEALDHAGLLTRLIPEWEPVRARPQRNAYHRFTVDRHSWQAVAEAARLADRVHRADLLLLGALFHDIGKGYPGDHSDVGVELVCEVAPRLGLDAADTETLATLVKYHLLLPEVATRRDLADPATVAHVVDIVRDQSTLELLATLTEADSLATGPTAWSPWKAELMASLVERCSHVLGGGDVDEVTWRLFPTGEVLARMANGELWVDCDGEQLVAVSPDLPGTLSRVAGALALHDLDVLSAQAHSDEQGMAASSFRFTVPLRGIDHDAVTADVRRALSSELAISARLADRARTYRRRRRTSAIKPETAVVFDHHASGNATVIEVRAPDTLGLLHRLTLALAELGLDVRHATVQTLGPQAIDTFYVRTRSGTKLLADHHRAEVERALLHAVGSTS
jgi:[protein-PII] uridylyltransferase